MSGLENRITKLEHERGISSDVVFSDDQMIRMYAAVLNELPGYQKLSHVDVTQIAKGRFDPDTKTFIPVLTFDEEKERYYEHSQT